MENTNDLLYLVELLELDRCGAGNTAVVSTEVQDYVSPVLLILV